MSKLVRATLVFGLVSGVLLFPIALLLTSRGGWPGAFKLALWADGVFYALLLARWSGTRPIRIAFPLGILFVAALWPGTGSGFFVLGLGVFSWVRSGICFSNFALRRMLAEVVTVAGGAGLVTLCRPESPLSWALAAWLFFLVQALYFFFMPRASGNLPGDCSEETFRSALRVAEKTLDGEPH